MKLYILQERWGNTTNERVVFITESFENFKKVIDEKYQLNKNDFDYFLKSKEIYDFAKNIAISFIEAETDKYYQLGIN